MGSSAPTAVNPLACVSLLSLLCVILSLVDSSILGFFLSGFSIDKIYIACVLEVAN